MIMKNILHRKRAHITVPLAQVWHIPSSVEQQTRPGQGSWSMCWRRRSRQFHRSSLPLAPQSRRRRASCMGLTSRRWTSARRPPKQHLEIAMMSNAGCCCVNIWVYGASFGDCLSGLVHVWRVWISVHRLARCYSFTPLRQRLCWEFFQICRGFTNEPKAWYAYNYT